MMTLPTDMITRLKMQANKSMQSEDIDPGEFFNPMDASGGNYDEAYSMGVEDGAISMARDVLSSLGISWTD